MRISFRPRLNFRDSWCYFGSILLNNGALWLDPGVNLRGASVFEPMILDVFLAHQEIMFFSKIIASAIVFGGLCHTFAFLARVRGAPWDI